MIWLALRLLLLILLDLYLITQGYHHLAFAFVIMHVKGQFTNTNCSFVIQNFLGLMLLLQNSSEGNALVQFFAFPSTVKITLCVLLICDGR